MRLNVHTVLTAGVASDGKLSLLGHSLTSQERKKRAGSNPRRSSQRVENTLLSGGNLASAVGPSRAEFTPALDIPKYNGRTFFLRCVRLWRKIQRNTTCLSGRRTALIRIVFIAKTCASFTKSCAVKGRRRTSRLQTKPIHRWRRSAPQEKE